MDYFDDEEFFDEEGRLIKTSWTMEEDRRKEEEDRKRRQREHEKKLAEADRIAGIESKASEVEEKIKENRRVAKLKDEWAIMPRWIKALPRTPLSAPPTDGTVNKLKFKITGKSELTDEERSERIRDLKRLKKSIDIYHSIHQELPYGTMPIISVIPTSAGSGATVVTRTMSRAIAESRNDLGDVASIDLGTKRNEKLHTNSPHLSDWFRDKSATRFMNLNSFFRVIEQQHISEYSVVELFAKASPGEYYIVNSGGNSRRKIDPSIKDIIRLRDFLNNEKNNGVALVECDSLDRDSLIASALASYCCVFVVDVSQGVNTFVDFIRDFGADILDVVDPDTFEGIIRNSIIVGNINSEDMMTKKGLKQATDILRECARKIKVDDSQTFLLPFEYCLASPPLDWGRMSWSGKTSIRKICGKAIETVHNYFYTD